MSLLSVNFVVFHVNWFHLLIDGNICMSVIIVMTKNLVENGFFLAVSDDLTALNSYSLKIYVI